MLHFDANSIKIGYLVTELWRICQCKQYKQKNLNTVNVKHLKNNISDIRLISLDHVTFIQCNLYHHSNYIESDLIQGPSREIVWNVWFDELICGFWLYQFLLPGSTKCHERHRGDREIGAALAATALLVHPVDVRHQRWWAVRRFGLAFGCVERHQEVMRCIASLEPPFFCGVFTFQSCFLIFPIYRKQNSVFLL